jgi:hypothetical protein
MTKAALFNPMQPQTPTSKVDFEQKTKSREIDPEDWTNE